MKTAAEVKNGRDNKLIDTKMRPICLKEDDSVATVCVCVGQDEGYWVNCFAYSPGKVRRTLREGKCVRAHSNATGWISRFQRRFMKL